MSPRIGSVLCSNQQTMKRLITLIIILIVATVSAQTIEQHVAGLRFGSNGGFGTELNYQYGLDDDNRLELGLGLITDSGYDAAQFTGVYQWVWAIEDGFQWYAGPGAGVVFINPDLGDNVTSVRLLGQVGIEYVFDFPLNLSLDTRPSFYFNDEFIDAFNLGIALSARYRF